jgi:hypothetical protein
MTPCAMAKAQKVTRSPARDVNGKHRGPSFRSEVSELISQQSLTSARQTFDALADKYPDLTAAQKTTIYGVLKDLGYGRSVKPRELPSAAAVQVVTGAPSLASMIAEADPSTIRAELASLREKQARVARSIKALEMLLGE